MDIWSKEKRSEVMARVRSRDTKPEIAVRRYLWAHGYRFRKNVRSLPGTPDIVLKKYRTVIFVHGCFWHGHETHRRHVKSNVDFWEAKIQRNRQRDAADKQRLLELGWNVITIWECQLNRANRDATLAATEAALNANFIRIYKPKSDQPTALPKPESLPYATAPDGDNLSIAAEPGCSSDIR